MDSIFSTYSQGENRVTSTIIAVFERLNPNTLSTILAKIIGEDTFELVKFENQVKKGENSSIPDARIYSNFELFIETKIKIDSVDERQIENHLSYLTNDYSKLLLLTPDLIKPFRGDDSRIIWSNFNTILEIIEILLLDQFSITERERFLLRELKIFLENSDVLSEDPNNIVTVVAAKDAFAEYLQTGLYICQQNRKFKLSKYFGFYLNGEIQVYFPEILGFIDDFNFSSDNIYNLNDSEFKGLNRDLKELQKRIDDYVNSNTKKRIGYYKIIVLSKHDDIRTLKRSKGIKNDKISKNGTITAFTQGHTYCDINSLLFESNKYTSQI